MKTFKYLEGSDDLMKEIRNALKAGDMDYEGKIRIRHILDVFVNDLGEEEIQNHLRDLIADYKRPRIFVCVDHLPEVE